jgi:perosamine synthetase
VSADRLAIDGGTPVRSSRLPYGRQMVDEADVAAVAAVLRSDWLTTGPSVEAFEQAFAEVAGTAHAVAVSSGTAALHAIAHAIGVSEGDEVIVPAITFAATANCVVYEGGRPVFADVDPHTLLVDPATVEAAVGPRTKALFAVDYAGQPCDYEALGEIGGRAGALVLADACHALGATSAGRPAGSLAAASAFSMHPVKPITTAEGGMVTTASDELAARARRFRSHGISTDFRQREQRGSWFYEMVELGFNYRLNDVQCALGLSQLAKHAGWLGRRREIARRYDDAFAGLDAVSPLARVPGTEHAYHLYVVQLELDRLSCGREQVFRALQAEGIGVNVHYIPVHLHPYYRERFGTGPGMCPVAEAAYERIVTLPMTHALTDHDVDDVVDAVAKVTTAYAA